MQHPDGVWNNGESSLQVDTGGLHSLGIAPDPAIPQLVLGTHVHPYLTAAGVPEGWLAQTYQPGGQSAVPYLRFRDYFRDQPLGANVPVDDGAFEIIADPSFSPQDDTILIITTPATISPVQSANQGRDAQGAAQHLDKGRFAYFGWARHSGVYYGNEDPPFVAEPNYVPPDPNKAWANLGFFAFHYNQGRPYNLVVAQAVPRIGSRSLVHQGQRNVQLVRTVQAILKSNQAPWSLPAPWQPLTADVPVMIEGGSVGGYTAVTCTALFPNDFHGAYSGGGVPSIRRYISEQESWYHLMALSGFVDSGKQFSIFDVLFYGRFAQQWGEAKGGPFSPYSAFFQTSLTRLFRDDKLLRPVYLSQNDEDSVTTGTDTLPLLDGNRTYHDHGVSLTTSGVPVFWTTTKKRCHDGGLHTTALGQTDKGTWDEMLEFLPYVKQSFDTNPTVVVQPPGPVDTTEDPYAALQIGPYPQVPANYQHPGSNGGGLILDPSFGSVPMASWPAAAKRPGKLFGSGTFLGGTDSLHVDGQYAFVGGAEGVVTRFHLDAQTLELVPQAQSPALGYGAWGLAVGDLMPGNPGSEVVVATWRGLYVLDRSSLGILASNTALPWEQSRPRHLRVLDMGGQKRVLFASDLGDLAVYQVNGTSLAQVAFYGEPGIKDLEVLSTTASTIDLVLLSERGHVIRIAWDITQPQGTPVQVLAVSERMNGTPQDLEFGNWPGVGSVVFALYTAMASQPEPSTIRALRADTLFDVTGDPGMPQGTQIGNIAGLAGSSWDLELVQNTNGDLFYVVLGRSNVHVRRASGQDPFVTMDLLTFAPMAFARDLAVGDLGHSLPNATFSAELLLSSQPGYVSWLPLDSLMVPPGLIPVPVNKNVDRGAGTVNAAPMWCNRTTVATWGMTVAEGGGALELIDQSGSRWRVDASGNATFRYETASQHRTAGGPTVHAGPLRDLFYTGLPASVAPGSPADSWATASLKSGAPSNPWSPPGAPSATHELETYPYVPEDTPGNSYRNLGHGTWTSDLAHRLYTYDGYSVFPKGGHALPVGDALVTGSTHQAHWWSGLEHDKAMWGNLVQGAYYDSAGILSVCASTARTLDPPGKNQSNVPHEQISGHDMRSAVALSLAMHDAQSLRIFQQPGAPGETRIAVGTPGGRVILLDPAPIPDALTGSLVETTSPVDFGYGGIALAVAPNTDQPAAKVDIYFGVLSHFANHRFHAGLTPTAAEGDIVGALATLQWDGSTLSVLDTKVLEQGPFERAYGVAGLTVGDIDPGIAGDELIAGTLDGRLLVYQRHGSGKLGALLYSLQLEGAVGAYNSIVVADLDGDEVNELYVAGSFGLRKFLYLPPAAFSMQR